MPSLGREAADSAASPGPSARAATPSPPRRRADARRNIEAILDAALVRFSEDPSVSMTEIARTAGVGRVTLYGHFPSREALLEALFERTLSRADASLDAVDIDTGPADEALNRLIASSWRILDRHRSLLTVALRHLGTGHFRDEHAGILRRVERLLSRGQRDGIFTSEVPLGWLVTTCYTLMHAAAEEVDAGHLASDDAPRVLSATLLGALSAAPAANRGGTGAGTRGGTGAGTGAGTE